MRVGDLAGDGRHTRARAPTHTRAFPPPQDKFERARHGYSKSDRWIVKPVNSSRGREIRLVDNATPITAKQGQSLIVQHYIPRPALIKGYKFDLRLYVLLVSTRPFEAHIFDQGLVRFGSVKYTTANRSLCNRLVHLTNFSINKKCSSKVLSQLQNDLGSHKWTLDALWDHLRAREDCDVDALWDQIKDIVHLTLLPVVCKSQTATHFSFELFGFDILLDEHLTPWLLEVFPLPTAHTQH